MTRQHWLLWDGDCEFCRLCVEALLKRDGGGKFHATSYQCAPTPPMTPELYSACIKSVHVITQDMKVYKGGRAVLFILSETGWGFIARLLLIPPFIWIVECGYWLAARNRKFLYRLLMKRSKR